MKKERRSEVNLTVSSWTLLDEAEISSSELGDRVPPVFLGTFETSHVVLDEDENYTLDCVAYGVPLPSITWVFTFLHGKGINS